MASSERLRHCLHVFAIDTQISTLHKPIFFDLFAITLGKSTFRIKMKSSRCHTVVVEKYVRNNRVWGVISNISSGIYKFRQCFLNSRNYKDVTFKRNFYW